MYEKWVNMLGGRDNSGRPEIQAGMPVQSWALKTCMRIWIHAQVLCPCPDEGGAEGTPSVQGCLCYN